MTLGASGSTAVDSAPATPAAPTAYAAHSRFAQRLRRRYAGELSLLPEGDPTRASMAVTFEALRARGDALPTALRVLRQLVMERLIVLDCDQQAPLSTITTTA